jgi:dimethylhistidine N-methyltransferase
MFTPRSGVFEPLIAERLVFAEEAEYYLSLSPRQLPSRFLYDELGSALFDAICRLPWYGVTRIEQRLLAEHAPQVLANAAPLSLVIELGPGNGDKLGRILAERDSTREVVVHLVDVSAPALDVATCRLASLDRVTVVAHPCEYSSGLAEIAELRRDEGRALVLCLGSNLGNFDPPDAAAFLQQIRTSVVSGDALLVGTDLVKPEGDLLLAYDDPLGVTAAFNRNLLVRLNRELGADFDVDAFAHRSIWNAAAARVEMHLVSRRAQTVHVPVAGLDIAFAADERIWTESSYKYEPEAVIRMLARAGFVVAAQWVEDGFALTLAHAAPMQ